MGTRRPLQGSYSADRAAGLAGVPRRTLYYWAKHGILDPSVSNIKPRLWSYNDVLALRLIDWLRRDKEETPFPRASMHQIRQLLSSVQDLGHRLERGLPVWIDPNSFVVVELEGQKAVPLGKKLLQTGLDAPGLDLLLPYGSTGPDLRWPRPTLRMLPGKLSGQPHVVDTRIETFAIAALAGRGLSTENIVELYPALTVTNVQEAIDLEAQVSSAA